MTLDEIIAGIAHTKCQFQNEVYNHFGTNPQCPACQLIAFRAELEEMVQKWNRREGWTFFGREDEGPLTLDCCANVLRAKIGENR